MSKPSAAPALSACYRTSHLTSAGTLARSPPVSPGKIPSHPVLVTAMVMRLGHRAAEMPRFIPADAGAAVAACRQLGGWDPVLRSPRDRSPDARERLTGSALRPSW